MVAEIRKKYLNMKKTRPFFSNSFMRLDMEEMYFSSLILSGNRETNSLKT